MNYRIPFNKSFVIGRELYYIADCILSGHCSGDGTYTKKCHLLLEQKFCAKKVLLTNSCTAALEMAAILCNITPGDEVILPSFTFVSTANAFYLRGAKIVFVDIRPDTFNMDETQLERLVTERTKIMVPVHYAGMPCEMDKIMLLAKKYGIFVVEDAAQAVNSRYRNQYLGTIGDMGTFSFHETKNFICGEGGALVINNEIFIERAEIIREKGTNRSAFFRGEVDKYSWIDIGSSYLPSDIVAAFLYAQLENMDQINQKRREIYDYYHSSLIPLCHDGKITLPYVGSEASPNCHIFYIILEDEKTRNALMNYLKSKGILAVYHYLPLHLSKMGQLMGYRDGQFPITESIASRLLRLPFFYELTRKEQQEVVNAIKTFFGNKVVKDV